MTRKALTALVMLILCVAAGVSDVLAEPVPFTSVVSSPAGEIPGHVTVGDFNGDGAEDVAVTDAGFASGGLLVFLGRGDGTLTPLPRQPLGQEPGAIVAEDFNGDGRVDLAVNDNASDSVLVLLGRGDGTFVHTTTIPLSTPFASGEPLIIGRR